ncbi:hypothetical protein FDK21_04390 [Cohaesibacter sp. CAU 1516]|uniref:hypothetical protein n=1 Tax=Cohaesibacter sp. CAU 1516 TaxID=2576038 RepID=UPI0010FDC2CB|nr:hypothetical protein [Cohaesibacter sp. CAU 1516]TLP48891.1 hypothetical protein FDK21_04390 [Cohaesibacter sp. CAU 1516]
MSETAPASDMLVDNNRTNNAAVGRTIRFHGRHNGQIVVARQPPKAAKQQNKARYPRINPQYLQDSAQLWNRKRTRKRSEKMVLHIQTITIHQHEPKMNDHLRLRSARISYGVFINQDHNGSA